MAALVASRPLDVPSRNPTPPSSYPINSAHGAPAAIPNKHIPFSSPGPVPNYGLLSPPASPPSKESASQQPSTFLFPPDSHSKISHDPPVYAINAATLANALEAQATSPLPDPKSVFPWLHGLHIDNHIQLTFFNARRRHARRAPTCLRGLTIVKAGGDLSTARLKGAVAPEEFLETITNSVFNPQFQDSDPQTGFSVRNFQIQTCKMAKVSDVVIYADAASSRQEVEELGKIIARAQIASREDESDLGRSEAEEYNTFIVTDPFDTFEAQHANVVAIDSLGNLTGRVLDFLSQEREEMAALSTPSEIAPNVWLGPTPESAIFGTAQDNEAHFDILLEASDIALMPEAHSLKQVEDFLNESQDNDVVAHLEFPSSGAFPAVEDGRQNEIDVTRLLMLCHWMHRLSNPDHASANREEDGDVTMTSPTAKPARRILIHCQDGYTETSLLGLAYYIFATGLPLHDAWISLHADKQRNFFTYPTDKFFLENIQLRLLQESPALAAINKPAPVLVERPAWLRRMDGSLPSRILPYLYLGNLGHAQNPALLRRLGITRVLSVGEPVTWSNEDRNAWGLEEVMFVDKVQDNGVDPLTGELDRCLDFIADARKAGGITLVHCRVGVSRSATICIAEVMRELGLTFPRAYIFTRARRLNVIIQPHLRFAYELLKYEESRCAVRGVPLRREMEWPSIAREIAAMNRPYCRE